MKCRCLTPTNRSVDARTQSSSPFVAVAAEEFRDSLGVITPRRARDSIGADAIIRDTSTPNVLEILDLKGRGWNDFLARGAYSAIARALGGAIGGRIGALVHGGQPGAAVGAHVFAELVGNVAGDAVGQAAGMALGVQDEFSFMQLGISTGVGLAPAGGRLARYPRFAAEFQVALSEHPAGALRAQSAAAKPESSSPNVTRRLLAKRQFDATGLSNEQVKIASTKSIRRHYQLQTNTQRKLIANADETAKLLRSITNWRRAVYAGDTDFLALDATLQGTIIHSSVSNRMRQLNVDGVNINRRLYGTSTYTSPATGAPYEFRIPDYHHTLENVVFDIKPAGTPLSGPQYNDFRSFANTNDVRWIYYERFR